MQFTQVSSEMNAKKSSNPEELISRLNQLQALKEAGALNEQEFEEQKKKLLSE